MKRPGKNRRKTVSTIHWCLLLTVSVPFLLAFTAGGRAEEEKTMPVYAVVDLKGQVQVRSATADSLSTLLSTEMALRPDQELVLAKDASLKIRVTEGAEMVLEGPMQGKLDHLLLLQKSKDALVKKTLDKIPAVTENETKVEMSSQTAGMTRGAKLHQRPMPYIWKIQKSQRTSSTESKEQREKK